MGRDFDGFEFLDGGLFEVLLVLVEHPLYVCDHHLYLFLEREVERCHPPLPHHLRISFLMFISKRGGRGRGREGWERERWRGRVPMGDR